MKSSPSGGPNVQTCEVPQHFSRAAGTEGVSEDDEASLERHVQLRVPLLDTCLYQ